MSKTLFIHACARENSRTLELAKCVLERLPGTVEEVDLYAAPLQPLGGDGLAERTRASLIGDFSGSAFRLAKQFAEADRIVIAAPYWDLMFPAVLKTYLEHVCVAGLTFRYSAEGAPVGLCRAGALYYVTTAGGYIGSHDFGSAYIRALGQTLFGIGHVRCFSAEGLDISADLAEQSLGQAKQQIARASLA